MILQRLCHYVIFLKKPFIKLPKEGYLQNCLDFREKTCCKLQDIYLFKSHVRTLMFQITHFAKF
jgi:hypothetical protein